MTLAPLSWPLAPPPACTASSLEVRARALRVLDGHRERMRRSAALVARSRALCATALAPAIPAPPAAPARPHLRLVPPEEPARSVAAPPRHDAACMRHGCGEPGAFLPIVVISIGDRRVTIRGLPLRVCPTHARDLETLTASPSFLQELRTRVGRRGGEAPGAIHVEFDPIH